MGILSLGRAIWIGFGAFAVAMTLTLYNAYMPLLYGDYLDSKFLVGTAMIIDNVIAITLQPIFGSLSDRVRSPIGRRLPFLLVGMPLAALFMSRIPLAGSLSALIAFTVLMNLGLAIFRSPALSLMPDLIPPEQRSQASGVIMLMGGIGSGVTFVLGSQLAAIERAYPFWLNAGLLALVPLVQVVALGRAAREVPPWESAMAIVPDRDEAQRGLSLRRALREVFASRDDNRRRLLGAIFLWMLGYGGIEAFFAVYATRLLGVPESEAIFSIGFLAVAFLLAAVPAGWLGARVGRRRAIMVALAVIVAVFLALSLTQDLALVRALLAVAGVGWAVVQVNDYPMVTEAATAGAMGAYTSLYYATTSAALILSPPLYGLLLDAFGQGRLFLWSGAMFALSWLVLRHFRGDGQQG